MDLLMFILGILYLCGMSVLATPIAVCCVVYGICKIIFAVLDVIKGEN